MLSELKTKGRLKLEVHCIIMYSTPTVIHKSILGIDITVNSLVTFQLLLRCECTFMNSLLMIYIATQYFGHMSILA